MFDPTLWGMVAVLAALCGLAYAQGGSELVREGIGDGGRMLLRFALLIVVAFIVAGVATKVVPHQWVSGALGAETGLRGIALATLAGAITPSGPFVSMPLAATLLKSGASPAAVVAFLSSWALLAVHRLFTWEIPMLGWRFALLRYAACIVLPLAAGMLVRAATRS